MYLAAEGTPPPQTPTPNPIFYLVHRRPPVKKKSRAPPAGHGFIKSKKPGPLSVRGPEIFIIAGGRTSRVDTGHQHQMLSALRFRFIFVPFILYNKTICFCQ